jgi:ABC-type maltose transport system permease subunit
MGTPLSPSHLPGATQTGLSTCRLSLDWFRCVPILQVQPLHGPTENTATCSSFTVAWCHCQHRSTESTSSHNSSIVACITVAMLTLHFMFCCYAYTEFSFKGSCCFSVFICCFTYMFFSDWISLYTPLSKNRLEKSVEELFSVIYKFGFSPHCLENVDLFRE